MSEIEQDPSASTGRFRAFVERGDDDDTSRARRSPVSPAMLIAGAVLVIAVIVIILAVA